MAPQKQPAPDFIPDGPPAFIPDALVAPAASPTPPVPGFIQRFGEATGIPTTKEALAAAQPSTAEMIGGPAVTAAKLVYNYGKNLYHAGHELFSSMPTTSSGNFLQDYANVNAPAAKFTNALAAPVGGQAAQGLTEDIDQGNLAGGAGDVFGGLANALLMKYAKGPSDTTATNKLAYAAGKGTTTDIAHSLADLRHAAKDVQPQTVDDFLRTVNKAKDNLSHEAGQAMMPIAKRSTVPIDISDKIRDLITPNLAQTPQGLAEIAKIKRAAQDFEKPWTYEQLDAERGTINKRLNPLYNKDPSGQYAAMGNRSTEIDKTIADAIRDKIYPEMDAQAGHPPGYFRALKQRHGNLINLQDALTQRADDLKDQTARIQGGPRLTDEQAASGALGHTGMARTALRAVHQPNPLATANRRVPAGFNPGSSVAKTAIGTLPARYLLMLPGEEEQPSLPAGHPLAQAAPTQ